MIGSMPLTASRLPTLANSATLGNPQGVSAQAQQLAELLAQYQQSQDQMAVGEELQGADYIKDSGSLGVLSAIASKYMGGRIRRKEGEKASDLTKRILAAQSEAEAQKRLDEENRKAAEQRADYQRKLEILRSGDANAIAAAGLKAPEQQKQEFQFYDSADGPVWIPKPSGIGADVLPQMEQTQGLDFDSLRAAVEQAESGGNPNAVSPKGAVGRMQTMPGTLADPGFGVTPARDGSDAEMTRVGTEYLNAMLNQYGDPRLALAAYNWGPGNVDAAMKRAGGNVDAVIASAPRETQDYVRKVGAMTAPRGGMDAIPVRGVRPKPNTQDGRVSYRTLSPAELEQRGYRPGTVVQVGSDGSEQVRQSPPTKTDVETKREQEVTAQMAAFDEIESLVNELEQTNSDSGTFELPFGPAREQYQNRASRLGVLLKPLIRTPGEGTWTDADQRLLERLVPQVSNYEGTNQEAISGIRSLLASKRAGLGGHAGRRGEAPAPRAPASAAIPSPTGLSQAGMDALRKYGGL